MFNRTIFNRTIFNRLAGSDASMYATILSVYGLAVSHMKVIAKLPVSSIASGFDLQTGALGLLAPLPPVSMAGAYEISGALYAFMPIAECPIFASYGTSVVALRALESDEMTLIGLNLKPGQSLIIDTDTLEIEVDGEARVDCWEIGGSFFLLKAGDNIIQFSDNAPGRSLAVTALWADRYL